MKTEYQIIVIGGGHAGAEAAWAAANLLREPSSVALVTANPARIGAMSCGGTRYADFFFLLMETDAAGELLLDIGFSSDSWVGELFAAAYSSFHDVSGIGGFEATAYRYNLDLTDFRMLSGPQMPSVPLPSSLACLTLALLAPAALRRRRA